MKKLIKLTLVVALVLGSSSLFAQKLGRINLEEIITLMPEYKEMMTNMEAYSKDLRDNLETIQVELNTKYNDFQKNKATYSEVTRQLKEKELTDLQNRLQEFYQSAQEDLQKKEKEPTRSSPRLRRPSRRWRKRELTSPYSIRPSPRWSITTKQP